MVHDTRAAPAGRIELFLRRRRHQIPAHQGERGGVAQLHGCGGGSALSQPHAGRYQPRADCNDQAHSRTEKHTRAIQLYFGHKNIQYTVRRGKLFGLKAGSNFAFAKRPVSLLIRFVKVKIPV
jgi:hypothetical protein